MVEVFVVLFVIWMIVTLVGHLSWVVTRGVFRLLTEDSPPGRASGARFPKANPRGGAVASEREADSHRRDVATDPADEGGGERDVADQDVAAFVRVLDRLVARGEVTADEGNRLVTRLRHLEGRGQDPRGVLAVRGVATEAGQAHRSVVTDPNRSDRKSGLPDGEPVLIDREAEVVDPDEARSDGGDSDASASGRGSGRAFSGAELIHSFLAAHNIRWGELVAGTLIVVCSIGLVVSLWSTLTATHRVIPSLIFMGGTASIFGAGLYTLSRWRLRHTSRAVLVIATLLVPLSVLAGLAAAGRSADAVSLDDALTWFAIAGGTAVYGYCLWRGGRALVGPFHAWPLAASVAGPSLLLPWVPAVVRWRPDVAGWCVGVAAIVMAAAFVVDARVGKRFGRPLGRVSGRNRALTLILGTFAYGAVVGYVAFSLRHAGPDAWRAISLGSIPAAIALAGACESISRRTTRGTLAVSTTTAGIVSYAAAWLMLVPSMVGPGWVWIWGGLMTASGCVVGRALRRDVWILISTIPLTTTVLITSPTWMGGIAWAELPLWRRLVGGEPMMVALAASVIAAIVGKAIRRGVGERVLWLSLGWGGIAIAIATVLAFGPAAWMGVVPGLAPLAVLIGGYVVATVWSVGNRRWLAVALPLSGVAWFAFVRATGMTWPPREFDALPWMGIAFGFAASALGSATLIRRLPRLRRMQPRELAGTLSIDRRAAVLASVVGCVLGVWGLPEQWRVVAGGLAVASGLSVWSAAGHRAERRFAIAQLLSFLAVVVAAWGWFGDHLVTRSSWRSGAALWAWCVVFAAMPVAWFLLRELLSWRSRRVGSGGSGARRGVIDRHFAPLTRSRRDDSIALCDLDRWAASLASGGLLFVSAVWFLGLVFDVVASGVSERFTRDVEIGRIMLATVSVGLVSVWWGRLSNPSLSAGGLSGGPDERRRIGLIVNSIVVAVSIWGTVEFFGWVTTDPAWRVIGATSTLFVACGLLTWTGFVWVMGRFARDGIVWRLAFLPIVVAAGCFGVSSVGLLSTGWFGRLLDGGPVDLPSTWAVTVWWTIASVGLLLATRRRSVAVGDRNAFGEGIALGEGVSAMLLPSACLVVTPAVAEVGVPVWVQSAGIGSAVWLGLRRWLTGGMGEERSGDWSEPIAVWMSRLWLQVIGLSTAVLVTAIYLFPSWGVSRLVADVLVADVVGPVGLIASVLAVVWQRFMWHRATWLGLTVLAGQIVWLGCLVGGIDASAGREAQGAALAVLGVWVMAATGSTIRFAGCRGSADYWHAVILSVAVSAIAATISPVGMFGTIGAMSVSARLLVAFTALTVGGVVLLLAERRQDLSGLIGRSIRPFGWVVLFVGVSWILASSSRDVTVWGSVAAWLTIWIVVWRVGCPDRHGESGLALTSRLPDGMASAALWLIIAAAAARTAAVGVVSVPSVWAWDLTLAGYGVCAVAAVVTGVKRAGRDGAWWVTLGLILVMAAVVAGRLSFEWTTDRQVRLAAMLMTAGFGLAVWTRCLRGLGRIAGRFGGSPDLMTIGVNTAPVRATWVWAISVSAMTSIVTIGWMSAGADAGVTRMTILVVALAAWSVVELAVGASGGAAKGASSGAAEWLRRTAVSLGLVTLALMASVGGGEAAHPWLEGAMRWLVAATVAIPTLAVILPRAVGRRFADPWRESLTLGAAASALAAMGSMTVMFLWEWRLRTAEAGIPELSIPMVFGVAVTLGALSGIAGCVAVFGWERPGHTKRPLIVVEDRYRRWSVWGAQAFGAFTWLHFYLCRPDLAFVGLREYWPLVVMGLAFASVGVTEWARRRGDRVLADTLRQTAVYLPLIPVLGFWLSGSSHDAVWRYVGGRVPYELLLAVGAIYYGLLSVMWKGVMPRVAAIVLANAAWWIVLVQTPGWAFMGHPQAWLIPPAACVLVVTHLYRDRLTPASASAIRYAAMLVIYISSTADMLIADVGETLAGPIVLILLALVGMSAGVVLRVKPFLYLGSAFVFVGVTSMVWHAQQAIDQTWPWWAFGITLGLILLAGLMTLEKNRPRLRELSERMASWEA